MQKTQGGQTTPSQATEFRDGSSRSWKPVQPVFNYEEHTKELNERFGRLIKQLGVNNRKGTPRYGFETEFAYAIHEIEQSPAYLQGKMFDNASSVVSSLINHLKTTTKEKEAA